MFDILKKFIINDEFLGYYKKLVIQEVIPYQEKVLKDQIPNIEKSHAVENFIEAAKMIETGKSDDGFYGWVFQDSDVAKWLEATAYSLLKTPNKELEDRCDEVIDLIGRAQHQDGYLNTYFTLNDMGKRWTNLEEAHELYCAGHMMEAAVAYAECTGKTKLLDIMCRMSDHIYNHFIEGKAEGYPGHPEVELALMKMYRYTGNKRYLELAEHFINVRGVDSNYFIKESEEHNWTVWGNDCHNKETMQNYAPVREQREAVGHAVRAVYLYTGMADLAKEINDETLKDACRVLWKNITERRMYVTGAIGSAYEGEAFTKDYHLPNDTAYGETCAAIGLIFFAKKMLDFDKSSEYADTMELALYNGVLAGMELDGKKFFYVNPLEVIPGISGKAVTHHHALPQRLDWFACACCPPNIARFLSSIEEYAWSVEKDTVYSHLYLGGTLDLSEILQGKINVKARYPYEGRITYTFISDKDAMEMTLAIRLPRWSKKTSILLNGKECDMEIKNGYAYITRAFRSRDEVEVNLDMSVRHIFASNKVSANNGKVAFSRGPLIYCAEGIDNNENVLGVKVNLEGETVITERDQLNGVTYITIDGYRALTEDSLYTYERPIKEPLKLNLIPYYTWGNRELSQMRVWLPY